MCDAPDDLRISHVGRGTPLTLEVDGKSIPAYEGETVLASLQAAGIRTLRRHRQTGEARGALCGMGICYECRVTINGVPDQRACMTPVEAGMIISTEAPS